MIKGIGVCSWSLQPRDQADLVEQLTRCGIRRAQIALGPLIEDASQHEFVSSAIARGRIELCSGMMQTVGEDYSTLESIRATGGLRPDQHWEANRAIATRCADLAQQLGLKLVTLHAGFIPEGNALEEQVMIGRLCTTAEIFNTKGITLGLETGQETSDTLIGVLSTIVDRVDVAVNFDPANMILYGMGDPIEALRALSPYIAQVHMKDAIATQVPGTWGSEVAAGEGQVDWDAFFRIVHAMDRPIDVVIEREAGDQRIEDIKTASALAQQQIERVRS